MKDPWPVGARILWGVIFAAFACLCAILYYGFLRLVGS